MERKWGNGNWGGKLGIGMKGKNWGRKGAGKCFWTFEVRINLMCLRQLRRKEANL